MNNKKQIKIIVVVEILILLYFLIAGGFLAYKKILKPAYYSVYFVCENSSPSFVKSKGYRIAGGYSSINKSIRVNVPVKYNTNWVLREQYKETKNYQENLKHEQCHKKQHERDYGLYGCDKRIKKYFGEVECYIRQYL